MSWGKHRWQREDKMRVVVKKCDCGRYFVRGRWILPNEMDIDTKVEYIRLYNQHHPYLVNEVKEVCTKCK